MVQNTPSKLVYLALPEMTLNPEAENPITPYRTDCTSKATLKLLYFYYSRDHFNSNKEAVRESTMGISCLQPQIEGASR